MSGAPEFGIVVVHRSASPYLAVCLEQARRCNPHVPVVLAGDASNAAFAVDRFVAIDQLPRSAAHTQFLRCYRHYSPSQSLLWERFCIERWFVVLAVMELEGFERVLALDSDVLLFCDAAEEAQRCAAYAVALNHWDGQRALPHCTFIQRREALEEFCALVSATYASEHRLEELKQRNQKRLGRHWISDMSLWHAWAMTTARPVLIRERLGEEPAIYDSCIEHVRGFEAVNPLPLLVRPWKRLVFEQGRAYGFRRHDGRRVRLLCVHYHGRFKALMGRHARGQADGLVAALVLLRLKLAELPLKALRNWRSYLRRLLAGPPAPDRTPAPRPLQEDQEPRS
ncbi:conserved hypothetical protein [Cyanobium sp. PCC 7001]|uniref:hypothetical protein n=1 Tax=Cyanobium sp. PCC 7001 TaxID=180281 RepID=UPI0001804D97|nr:hypothetical protein [Cyanobium sp. PCC 7001]EDY37150.1 conserved hypothetical protein [Cyanobium sp. PCC 7001]